MDAAHPDGQSFRYRHSVLWNGVIFGVVAGVAVAAAGAGKVTQGQETLVVAGGFVAACCYALAGAFAARPGYSARDGLKAGLLAGVISAAIMVPVDLILTQAFMSVYLPHMEAMNSYPGGHLVILTPAQVYGYEVLGMTYLAVGSVVAGLGLGWLGGYYGSGTRVGWQRFEKPKHEATVPDAPSEDASAAETPSGPHWELAHPSSPSANKPIGHR